MAGINLGFELLSTVNEGDERSTLSEVLSLRDTGLSDLDLWAVCRASCQALESVHDSPEMFQSLCVTPDSLAFDALGNVCFLDLAADPESLYIPPEYETLGNSFKAHMYSLGMTMLYASEYNSDLQSPAQQRPLSNPLNTLISQMTLDDFEQRLDIAQVSEICQENLDGCSVTADRICQELVAVVRMDTPPVEEDAFSDARSLHMPLDALQEMWLATAVNNLTAGIADFSRSSSSQTVSSRSPTRSLSSISPTSMGSQKQNASDVVDPPEGFDDSADRSAMERELSLLNAEQSHSRTLEDIYDSDQHSELNRTFHDLIGVTDPEMMTLDESEVALGDSSLQDMFGGDECLSSASQPVKLHGKHHAHLPKSFFDFEHIENPIRTGTPLKMDTTRTDSQSSMHTSQSLQDGNRGLHVAESASLIDKSSERVDHHMHDMSATAATEVSTDEESDSNEENSSYITGRDTGHGSTQAANDSSPINCHLHNRREDTQSQFSHQGNALDHCTSGGDVDRDEGLLVNRSRDNAAFTHSGSEASNSFCHVGAGSLSQDTGSEGVVEFELSQVADNVQSHGSSVVGEDEELTQLEHRSDDERDSESLESEYDGQDLSSIHDLSGTSGETDEEMSSEVWRSAEKGSVKADGIFATKLKRWPSLLQSGGQTVAQILNKLGAFHESELWALCRECVVALLRDKQELPPYVSLETVVIGDNGHVSFCGMPEDQQLEVEFLAPELRENRIVTEKTCLFGVAAVLWSAADFRLPERQEPILSETFEDMLLSMTQNDVSARPSAVDIFKKCNDYHLNNKMSSVKVCRVLASDARNAAAYGKDNVVVQSIVDQEILQQKSKVMESIKLTSVKLKPAENRKLSEVETEQASTHTQLMSDLQNRKQLRKVPTPPVKDAAYIFNNDPKLMSALRHVTRKVSIKQPGNVENPTNSAFSVVQKDTDHDNTAEMKPKPIELPQEYNSTATHFAPIILNGNKSMDDVTKNSPKSSSMAKADEQEKKIKALKKNLLRLRGEMSLVQDIERDAELEDQMALQRSHAGERSLLSVSGIRSPVPVRAAPSPTGMLLRGIFGMKGKKSNTKPQGGGDLKDSPMTAGKLKSAKTLTYPDKQSSTEKAPDLRGFLPQQNNRESQGLPVNVPVPQQLHNHLPGTFNHHPTTQDQSPVFQFPPAPVGSLQQVAMKNVSPHVEGITPLPQGISPTVVHPHPTTAGHVLPSPIVPSPAANSPALQPGQSPVINTSIPGQSPYGLPLSLHPGMLPFQCQLQQDPRTGLVHVVPVALPQNLGVQSFGQMPSGGVQMPVMSGLPLAGVQSNVVGQRFDSPLGDDSSEKSEKRLRSSKRRDRRSHKHRHRHCECEDCESRHSCRHKSRERVTPSEQEKEDVTVAPRQKASERVADAAEDVDERSRKTKDTRPRFMRVRDQTGKLKRAKSGSSLDFEKLTVTEIQNCDTDEKFDDFCECGRTRSLAETRPLSKSQPSLASLVKAEEISTLKSRRANSPDPEVPSPPLSPSWSKDSGVSGLHLKGSGDTTLMERLLNSNTIKHQQRLARVIKLLREDFSYEGYMENGVEDLAMAEYVLSLAGLKWETFNSAVTEKYSDLYWQEDLLSSLYEAINDQKPSTHKPGSAQSDRRQHPLSSAVNSKPTTVEHGDNFASHDSESRVNLCTEGTKQEESRDNSNKQSRTEHAVTRDNHLHFVRKFQRAISHNDLCRPKQGLATSMNTSLDENGLRYSVADIDIESEQDHILNSSVVSLPVTRPKHRGNVPQERAVDVNSAELEQHPLDPSAVITSESRQQQRKIRFKSQSSLNLSTFSTGSNKNEYRIVPTHHDRPRLESHDRQNNNDKYTSTPSSTNNRRDFSILSRSTSHLATIAASDTDGEMDLGVAVSVGDVRGLGLRIRRSEVAYYWTEMGQEEWVEVINQQESLSREDIEKQLLEIDQGLSMEHRNRRKALKYFSRLADVTNRGVKGPTNQRPMLTKMSGELDKNLKSISSLDIKRKHLEVMYAEQWGLDPELLYALAKCPGDKPMLLSACTNPLVQYQMVHSVQGYNETASLQAATPLGLMACLYAQDALTSGFIHHFFYCYRYFIPPIELLRFICDKFSAALCSLSPTSEIPLKVTQRSLDLLCTWVDGYFGVDFENSPALLGMLEKFINEKLSSHDCYHSELSLLLEECKEGRHIDLLFSKPTELSSLHPVSRQPSGKNPNAPRKWESFKAALHLPAKPQRVHKLSRATTITSVDRRSGMEAAHVDLILNTRQTQKRSDTTSLTDLTPQILAEQLTLLEQELFQKAHPVHFLNSKAQGVAVSMVTTVLTRSRSIGQMKMAWDEHPGNNLFVGTHSFSDIIQRLVEHSRSVAFWVTAEVISCNSIKAQAALLSKFLLAAKSCGDMQNYATCLSIADGLENVIIRHLPAWKNVQSKHTNILTEIAALRLRLRGDSQQSTDAQHCRSGPVIPSALLFLLHMQQLEIGSFLLANNMCKWAKIRTIVKAVDQIRLFQQHMFDIDPDHEVQDFLRHRIQELGAQDLGVIAQQGMSSQKVTGRRFQGAFKRMKERFHGRSDF